MAKTWKEMTEEIAELERINMSLRTEGILSAEKGRKLQKLINTKFPECKHERVTAPEFYIDSVCLDCGILWKQSKRED